MAHDALLCDRHLGWGWQKFSHGKERSSIRASVSSTRLLEAPGSPLRSGSELMLCRTPSHGMFTALCDGTFTTCDCSLAAACDGVFTYTWSDIPHVRCAERSQIEREFWRNTLPGEEARKFQVGKKKKISAPGGDSSRIRLNQGASTSRSLG